MFSFTMSLLAWFHLHLTIIKNKQLSVRTYTCACIPRHTCTYSQQACQLTTVPSKLGPREPKLRIFDNHFFNQFSFFFSFFFPFFPMQKLKSQMALSECGHFPASPWVGSGCWHPILPMARSMSFTWHGKWCVGIANLWCLWGGKGCWLLAGRPVASPTWHVWAASVVQTEGAARRILSTAWVWFLVLPIRGSSFFIAESLVHWATSVCSGVSPPIVLG